MLEVSWSPVLARFAYGHYNTEFLANGSIFCYIHERAQRTALFSSLKPLDQIGEGTPTSKPFDTAGTFAIFVGLRA
jgi:hypothetical protein